MSIIQIILAHITKESIEEKESNDSNEKFSVCLPRVYAAVFIFTGWFFIVLCIGIYFYNGIAFHDYDMTWIYAGAGVAGGVFLLWLISHLWRLDVDGNWLYYRTFWGRKKSASFHAVNRIEISKQRSLVIFADQRRFGTINRDFIGYDNFLARCEDEKIEITSKSGKPLSK